MLGRIGIDEIGWIVLYLLLCIPDRIVYLG